mmetsp:Transcript_25800/g.50511  ORF Transcript_25800/g.50511 Transcript_25800/m.50511 type:complete len:126 (-) Transcript_25800:745-1122(-)
MTSIRHFRSPFFLFFPSFFSFFFLDKHRGKKGVPCTEVKSTPDLETNKERKAGSPLLVRSPLFTSCRKEKVWGKKAKGPFTQFCCVLSLHPTVGLSEIRKRQRERLCSFPIPIKHKKRERTKINV